MQTFAAGRAGDEQVRHGGEVGGDRRPEAPA